MTLVKIDNFSKHFPLKSKTIKAVDQISLSIEPGETLGLVGESGCGKSTVGRALMRLFAPTAGKILFNGEDITKAPRRDIQMIFQDPYASLNPRMTAGEIIEEPLILLTDESSTQRSRTVQCLLEMVGLSPDHSSRYPHEFSGGQRQRICIARALAVKPRFIVCDEPIAALDVSIQAQITNLLKKLQGELGLTYLFISHDLSMVRYLSNHVAVMYLGQIVEYGPTQEVFDNPLHPYTQALLSAIPIPDPSIEQNRSRIVLQGDVPNLLEELKGCPFASRCPRATTRCQREVPAWREVEPARHTSCHLFDI